MIFVFWVKMYIAGQMVMSYVIFCYKIYPISPVMRVSWGIVGDKDNILMTNLLQINESI